MAKQVYALDAELKEAVQLLVRQMANSFQPRPKRGRRPRRGGEGTPGTAGSSGVLVCTLSSAMDAADIAALQMGTGAGSVYKIIAGGGLELVTAFLAHINNPFSIELPQSISGVTVTYLCARTFHDPASGEGPFNPDDEFTITGPDPIHSLAFQPGFGGAKVLYMPEGETLATAMRWDAEECGTP